MSSSDSDVTGPKYVPVRTRLRGTAMTFREVEVLHLIAGGLQDKQIAFRLGLSIRTVETHRRKILARLGATNITHALALYLLRGVTRIDVLRRALDSQSAPENGSVIASAEDGSPESLRGPEL